MVWVRSEYAGELAVLSAWLAALVPWNVTYSPGVAGGSLLFVRFPFVQVRYTFGVPFAKGVDVRDPLSAVALQAGYALEVAYQTWVAGAAVLALAVLLSVAYYARERGVERGLPIDPVRLMGGLLGLAGVVFLAANALLTRGFPGVPIPIGALFCLAFGGILLTVDLT
jgi:uncharacterized protein (TIGR04206 family)